MNRVLNTLFLALTAATRLVACGEPDSSAAANPGSNANGVVVNGANVSTATLNQIKQNYGILFEDGNFWYDSRSGLAGLVGQPPAAILPANLPLTGRLNANASNGNTGVFINGRELSQSEVQFLSQFGQIYKARYWLDANGTFGFEGYPAAGNLYQLIQSSSSSNGGGGGGNYNANGYTNSYSNSQGGCSYVMTDSGTATSGCG